MTRRAGDEKEDSTVWKVTSQDVFVACEIVAIEMRSANKDFQLLTTSTGYDTFHGNVVNRYQKSRVFLILSCPFL